jgi:hypothetical protein
LVAVRRRWAPLGRVDKLEVAAWAVHRNRIMMEATWTKARKLRAVFS